MIGADFMQSCTETLLTAYYFAKIIFTQCVEAGLVRQEVSNHSKAREREYFNTPTSHTIFECTVHTLSEHFFTHTSFTENDLTHLPQMHCKNTIKHVSRTHKILEHMLLKTKKIHTLIYHTLGIF